MRGIAGLLLSGVVFALWLYTLVLLARVVLDWIRVFARDWRPRGILLVVANLAYSLTDPPLQWLRRFIPPLRIGNIALDMGFLVLFFGIVVLQRIALLVASLL